jgi:hypothetical protein
MSKYSQEDYERMLAGYMPRKKNIYGIMLEAYEEEEEAKEKKAGVMRELGDTGLGIARGAVGATKALTDVFGADNRVSGALNSSMEWMGDLQSEGQKAQRALHDKRRQEAEATGSVLEEIKAAGINFFEDPIDYTAEGLGSLATVWPLKFIGAGSKFLGMSGRTAGAAGLGTAQGVGAVKGAQYEAVKNYYKEQGKTEEEAEELATAAQSYAAENALDLGTGGLFGLVAGTTGAERLLLGKGGDLAKQNILKRAGIGVATETPMEAAQGGQEKLAANRALNREGADIDPWGGVAYQATSEGLMSAPVGAGMAMAAGPLTQSLQTAEQAAAEQAELQAKQQAELAAKQAQLKPVTTDFINQYARSRFDALTNKQTPLTEEETVELAFIQANINDPAALAEGYEARIDDVEHIEMPPASAITTPPNAAGVSTQGAPAAEVAETALVDPHDRLVALELKQSQVGLTPEETLELETLVANVVPSEHLAAGELIDSSDEADESAAGVNAPSAQIEAPTAPVPDKPESIVAQVSAMLDPQSGKDAVLIPAGSVLPFDLELPDTVMSVDLGEQGEFLTTNKASADILQEAVVNNALTEELLGQLLYGVPGKPADATHVTSVVDTMGNPTTEIVTGPSNQAQVDAAIDQIARPSDAVIEQSPEAVIAQRTEAVPDVQEAPPGLVEPPLDEQVNGEVQTTPATPLPASAPAPVTQDALVDQPESVAASAPYNDDLTIPLPKTIEQMASGKRSLYKVDEVIASLPSLRTNITISDSPDERGVAHTPEKAISQLLAYLGNIADQDGKLRSNNRTNATTGTLLDNIKQYHATANDIRASRQENPQMWADYAARQAEVQKLNIGDRVLTPYGGPEDPYGAPAVIVKKHPKNWKVRYTTGVENELLIPPSSLRPVTPDNTAPSQGDASQPTGEPIAAQPSQLPTQESQAQSATTADKANIDSAKQDGSTDIVPNDGLIIVHGSGNPNLSVNDIQVVRQSGQKQGKKGRVYGGFYGAPMNDVAQAQNYADMMGGVPTVYEISIKPGTKVFHKDGDITRLSEKYINDLVAQGYGVVTGKSPVGKTEIVVIDRNAVRGVRRTGEQVAAQSSQLPTQESQAQSQEGAPVEVSTPTETKPVSDSIFDKVFATKPLAELAIKAKNLKKVAVYPFNGGFRIGTASEDTRRENDKVSTDLIQRIKAYGGIKHGNLSEELSGEKNGNTVMPGLFSNNGIELDLIIEKANLKTDFGINDTRELADAIRAALVQGDKSLSFEGIEAQAEALIEKQRNDAFAAEYDAMVEDAKSLGIDTIGKKADQLRAELLAAHDALEKLGRESSQIEVDLALENESHLDIPYDVEGNSTFEAIFGEQNESEQGSEKTEDAGTKKQSGEVGPGRAAASDGDGEAAVEDQETGTGTEGVVGEVSPPSSADINSGRATVDRINKEIDQWVNNATNNGTRPLDKNWERGAVKRFIEAEVAPVLAGKQYGNRAAAKIAVGKAVTFDDLRAAIAKYADKPIEEDTPNAEKPKKLTQKQRNEEAAKAVRDVLRAGVGDTLVFNQDVDYITAGRPMVIDSIGANGRTVYVKNPETGAGTTLTIPIVKSRAESGGLTWTVTPVADAKTDEVSTPEEAKRNSPIENLGEPPHLNYRVEKTALNSVKLLPPVGKQFTADESASLMQWVKDAGFSAWRKEGSSFIKVVGEGAPDIIDGLAEQRSAKANAKQTARDEKAAAIKEARAAEYAGLPSSAWIESVLGADFANEHNKTELARYLDGKGKFEGLTSRGWIEPLERLGYKWVEGGLVSDMLEFLKAKYDDQSKQPGSSAPDSKPALLAELREKLSALAGRAMEVFAGKLAGQLGGFTTGMKDNDANLTRKWVDDVIRGYEKLVAAAEKMAAKSKPDTKDDKPDDFNLESPDEAKLRAEGEALAATEKAEKESAAKAEAEAKKQRQAKDDAERKAKVLADREAEKKAEIDATVKTYQLGDEPPAPVSTKMTKDDLAGQANIFDAPANSTPAETPESTPTPRSTRKDLLVYADTPSAFRSIEVDVDGIERGASTYTTGKAPAFRALAEIRQDIEKLK